jgi:uncharacterized protein (DUF1786 family)
VRALAIDIGTGTQDVLLFDSEREIENAVRLVLPSPTVLIADQVRRATEARWGVVLSGSIMGGGPCAWAIRDHAAAGLPICATPDGARTIDDDLDGARAMGVRIVTAEEAATLGEGTLTISIQMGDIWLDALSRALGGFGIDLHEVDAVCVAVFDHGAAPPGVSDRRFRFERLEERLVGEPDAGPAAFAYLDGSTPAAFTRLSAAAAAVRSWFGAVPPGRILAIDTAPAAVLGALDDEVVAAALRDGTAVVAANVGNFHALAMRVSAAAGGGVTVRVDAVMEHHTGEISGADLGRLLCEVGDGTVDGEEVFHTMGHGAYVRPEAFGRAPRGSTPPLLSITGPRRAMLRGVPLKGFAAVHESVPHGDMMQAGTFGMLRALAHRAPEWRDPIASRLDTPRGP